MIVRTLALAATATLALAACQKPAPRNETAATPEQAAAPPGPNAATSAVNHDESGAVLKPTAPAGGEMLASRDVLANIEAAPELSTFAAAIKAAGLSDTLAKAKSVTVFAPTNAAFRKLPAGILENLMKADQKPELAAVVGYHLLPGAVRSEQIRQSITGGHDRIADMTSANDFPLTAQLNGDQLQLIDGNGNVANVTKADIPQANGLLYIIDRVLIPVGS